VLHNESEDGYPPTYLPTYLVLTYIFISHAEMLLNLE
jgi:hypothetical protein